MRGSLVAEALGLYPTAQCPPLPYPNESPTVFTRRKSSPAAPAAAATSDQPLVAARRAGSLLSRPGPLTPLSADERLQRMIYFLEKAREAGKGDGGSFDAEAAVNALTDGKMQLSGTPDEIQAQLLLAEAMAALVKRALVYQEATKKSPQPEQPRPQPIRQRQTWDDLDK